MGGGGDGGVGGGIMMEQATNQPTNQPSRYIVKVDDDTYLHFPNFIAWMRTERPRLEHTNVMFGPTMGHHEMGERVDGMHVRVWDAVGQGTGGRSRRRQGAACKRRRSTRCWRLGAIF